MSDDLHQTASGKRRDVISWDEFFMSVAIAAQRRSKDPNTQVGACIASTNHRILSVGYNGTPSALNDDFFPWGTSDDPLQDKHNYVVHAEANAIISASRRDSRLLRHQLPPGHRRCPHRHRGTNSAVAAACASAGRRQKQLKKPRPKLTARESRVRAHGRLVSGYMAVVT